MIRNPDELSYSGLVFSGYDPYKLIKHPNGVLVFKPISALNNPDAPEFEVEKQKFVEYYSDLNRRIKVLQQSEEYRSNPDMDLSDFKVLVDKLYEVKKVKSQIDNSCEVPNILRRPEKFYPKNVVINGYVYSVRSNRIEKMIFPYCEKNFFSGFEYVLGYSNKNIVLLRDPRKSGVVSFEGILGENINDFSNSDMFLTGGLREHVALFARDFLKADLFKDSFGDVILR